MASQPITTPKRAVIKATRRKAQKRSQASTNGDDATSAPRRKPLREMTLEELSLRAYKMTYEQLHGSKSIKK